MLPMVTGSWVAPALYVVAGQGIADLLRDDTQGSAALASVSIFVEDEARRLG